MADRIVILSPGVWKHVSSENSPKPLVSEIDTLTRGGSLRALVTRLPMTVFWALAAQGLMSVTRLLTSMTVGGRFGSGSEEELGYYANGFSLLMILVAIFEAFITTPLTVFNQRQKEENRQAFWGHMLGSAGLLLGLMSSIAAVWILLELNFHWIEKPELSAVLIAVSVIGPLQLVREFARRWLLANMRAGAAAWLEVLFAGLFLLSLFTLVCVDRVSAITVFVTIGLVNLLGIATWWWIYRRQFVFTTQRFSQQVSDNVRYGKWVAGENVCSALAMYFCNWFLMYQIDEAAAGVFFACLTVVLLANPFLLGVGSILAPRAAAAFNDEGFTGLRRVLFQFGSVILVVLIAFSGVLWMGGDRLTDLFFGPKYGQYFEVNFNGENRITAILGLAMPIMGLSYISAFGLLAVNRPNLNFYAAVAGLVVLVVANLSFAEPKLDTAAFSFVLSFAVAAMMRFAFLVLAFVQQGKLK